MARFVLGLAVGMSLGMYCVDAHEADLIAEDREKTGFDVSPGKSALPCYLLGEKDQIEAKQNGFSITKRAGRKNKPFPSLTQCYRYNTFSCCVSGHDDKIKGDYESLLSSTCLREYDGLEFYYCLGCHPDQGKYTRVYHDYSNATDAAGRAIDIPEQQNHVEGCVKRNSTVSPWFNRQDICPYFGGYWPYASPDSALSALGKTFQEQCKSATIAAFVPDYPSVFGVSDGATIPEKLPGTACSDQENTAATKFGAAWFEQYLLTDAQFCRGKCAENKGCSTSGCDGHLNLCSSWVYGTLFPDCRKFTSEAQCTSTKSNKCCWGYPEGGPPGGKCMNGEQGAARPLEGVFTCKNSLHADNPDYDAMAWSQGSYYDTCALNTPDGNYRLPSYWYTDAEQFVTKIKPPFFHNFAVKITEPGHGNGIDSDCFTNSVPRLTTSGAAMFLLTLVATFIAVPGLFRG